MSDTANLLVELFVEELPPKDLRKLGAAFANVLFEALRTEGFAQVDSVATGFASPRRLGVHVTGVSSSAPDRAVTVQIMPTKMAFDANGQPTAALQSAIKKKTGFSSFESVPPHELSRDHVKDKEYLFHSVLAAGRGLARGLQEALDAALASLPIRKVMSYPIYASAFPQVQPGWTTENFVRPAHGLVALHGKDVIGVSALHLQAGRTTHGHRFDANTETIELRDADSYASQLEHDGAVIASFAARRADIVRQLQAAAAALDLRTIEDEALLDEVTGLVERPNVLTCQFDTQFLDVPSECLILTMKANQKYFPLIDTQGKLTNRFLVVSNIRPADPSRVIEGNERVVRPRLADAKFFFDQDRKKSLESRVPALDKVVYHGKLGSLGERVLRVRSLARAIGEQLGGPALAQSADRAALLAKADLLTDMVGEFPELQGIMGGYYARHDGETEAVAFAIEDHYKPRFAGDSLPRDTTGVVLALADKLETLAGLFGIGQVPTGDKDPFALRRHALGIVRLQVEKNLPLGQFKLVELALSCFPEGLLEQEVVSAGLPISKAVQIEWFLNERAIGYWREKGFAERHVDAVHQVSNVPSDHGNRLAAVARFAVLPEAPALASANKRVANMLKKSFERIEPRFDQALLTEPAEKALAEALAAVKPIAEAAFLSGDYTTSLRTLSALKMPVDAFFDGVMVDVQDAALRMNRLGLLAQLRETMNRVADLSELAA